MSRHLWVPLLAWSSGCIEYTASPTHGIDIYELPPEQSIDVLLVVDDSESMGPYQEQLGANYAAFISWFVEGNVDYQIGITTTDDGNDPNVPDPARGALVGPIITSDMDAGTAEALFRDEINVGTDGSGVEVGLNTAYLALADRAHLADQIDEFLRPDAELSIVFVSDEEDSSPWPVNDYINAFFELKGHRDRDVFNASALTVTDESKCSDVAAAYSSPGTRYVDVARQTHGLSGNLCDQDFSHIVGDLSLANSRISDTYVLGAEPDPSTLEVTLTLDGEDTVIPCDDGAWSYARVNADSVTAEDQPAVVFELDRLPRPGSKLQIRYLYGDGDPTEFCGGTP
jgi:hypothetical protein